MMSSIAARWTLACSLLGGAVALCAAQTYTPPPPPLTTLPPCPADGSSKDKDAKKRARRKDCDPTVYPSATVEKKGKTSDAADSTIASPVNGAPPAGTSAAQAHPYPGDSSADMPSASGKTNPAAGAAHPYPGDNGKDLPGEDLPHDPAAEKRAADTPAGKANPFPSGTTPDMPTDAAGPATKPEDSQPSPPATSSPEPASSSSSSSSSSDDAAAHPGTSARGAAVKNPDDDDDDGPPKLNDKGSSGRRAAKVAKPQSDTERVDEDLSVAKFYGQSGNFMGAYLRAKDAVKIQPEYPAGHFALGEAAKRLKKNDEAAAEFQAYLKLAPDGEKAKAAEKALDELK